MKKSYKKLVKEETHRYPEQDAVTKAVSAATDSLRRHNPREVMCSQCVNNDEKCFQVTKIGTDANLDSTVTEINCKRCNKTSYVCHSPCCCQPDSGQNCLEYSYKEKMRKSTVQQYSKSTQMCSVLEATVAVLISKYRPNGRVVCSCDTASIQPRQVIVGGVDRLGFITSIHCPNCHSELAFSPLEESYVVQMLYHGKRRYDDDDDDDDDDDGQSDRDAVIQRALNRDYVGNIRELCALLRRHSFYDVICPEIVNDDQESCRVIDIDKCTGKVNEVEFVAPAPGLGYNQRFIIACRPDCYYAKYLSDAPEAQFQRGVPSRYETSYKEKVKAKLEAAVMDHKPRSERAILSCTVLAGTAAILRRHNIDNTLCQNCKNDDHEHIEVKEVDDLGFITRVKCLKCEQSLRDQPTECHRSRFYYEEIDESVTLKRGDHISWHKVFCGYSHHAIVTRFDDETVAIAEYSTHDSACHVTLKESIKPRRVMSPTFLSTIPYRITYEDCYTNEYTALRAERCIGEDQYSVYNRNCEHASYWSKTGLRKSDQVKTCCRSVWKTFLADGLRLVNMLLLMVFQGIYEEREGNQKDRKAFELFERIIIFTYMSIVFVLFLVWSLYTDCKKLKQDIDKCCCNRPPCVVFGLYIRIITRELCASVGPFLVIFFEGAWDNRIPHKSARVAVIILLLLVASLLSYGIGEFLGTLLENICRQCSIHVRKCSCVRREQSNDDSNERRPTQHENELHDYCSDTDTSTLTENRQK